MNISLKTDCFDFQLTRPDHGMDCTIDETGPYVAANNDNPYDEAGLIHNEALAFFRANRAKVGKDRTKYLDLYADFLKARGLKTPAMQALAPADYPKTKEALKRLGIFDGVIPICFPYPDLPGFPGGWPVGWPNTFKKTGDPVWIIYMVYKMLKEGRTPIFLRKQIVTWETDVLNSSATEAEKARDLISASVMRYSLGYWHEQGQSSTNEAKRMGWPWAFVADAVGSLVGSLATPIVGVATGATASGVVEAILDEKKKG
jgi:hypothetical protein